MHMHDYFRKCLCNVICFEKFTLGFENDDASFLKYDATLKTYFQQSPFQ